MLRHMLAVGLVCGGLSVVAVAGDNHKHEHKTSAQASNAGFERLKSLAGTWVAADEKGNPTDEVVSVIKVTAGDSAVQETLFPGQPHEMVSVYTAEGPNVLMTHYCMLGNQPRMKAKGNSADELTFEFVGGANLDPAKDKHMHGAVVKFTDDDHFEVNGVGWEDGKPAKEMCGTMKLVRKK